MTVTQLRESAAASACHVMCSTEKDGAAPLVAQRVGVCSPQLSAPCYRVRPLSLVLWAVSSAPLRSPRGSMHGARSRQPWATCRPSSCRCRPPAASVCARKLSCTCRWTASMCPQQCVTTRLSSFCTGKASATVLRASDRTCIQFGRYRQRMVQSVFQVSTSALRSAPSVSHTS